MTQYRFYATAMAQMKASGEVEANSLQDARVEARTFLNGGNGEWTYDGLADESIEVEVEPLHPVKPRDPQKSLRVKVRRAFDELTGIAFGKMFHEDLVYFCTRVCREKRPWSAQMLKDAEDLLNLAARKIGEHSLFNKGGQAYVALKAIKKCLS